MLRTLWPFVLGLVCMGTSAPAQTFDLDKTRIPVSELNGLWRFHPGDDAAWANPTFDDSAWSLVRSDRSWFDQGYRAYGGVGWYRFRVLPPATRQPLAIYIPVINDSYQVHVNGQLIGEMGRMPPHPRSVFSTHQVFRLPETLTRAGGPLVFAIRVWRGPLLAPYSGAGPLAAPVLGNADLVSNWRDLQLHRVFWELTDSDILMLVNLLTAILGVSLFALRPSEREYAWYGMAQLVWTLHSIIAAAPRFVVLPYISTFVVWLISFKVAALLNLEFFLALFRRRRSFAWWIGVFGLAIPVLLFPLVLRGWITMAQFGIVNACAFLPYAVVVPLLLLPKRGESKTESELLFFPFTLGALSIAVLNVIDVFGLTRFDWIAAFTRRYTDLANWPFPMSAGAIIGVLCNCAVGGVLILRFARTRRDEERLAAELEAARAVQHVMVPDEIAAISGFHVECVYRAAGQVSGDFFQILALPRGDAIIAIGDVSGKGMPAALTVALIVGTLHMAVESTSSPSALLACLNRRLIGRTACGFTTCLILHVSSTGFISAANAGHLAPYLEGTELPVEPGLPLGLDADTAYSESRFQLAPNQQLMLITDGVVEARSPTGELFGFERTRALSTKAAQQVAEAAQSFGQQDDITVLTLCMLPVPVPA